MDVNVGGAILVVLIVLSGVFSGVEAAFLSLSRIKVKRLVKLGVKNAEVVKALKDDSHKLIITLLIGNNLVNIGASSIATAIALRLLGDTGIAVATGVMTFLILIFGEIIPKSKAIHHAENICLSAARPIKWLQTFLYPAVLFFDFITRKLMGATRQNKPLITEDELKSFVEIGEETGSIESGEKEMIHNILRLNDLIAKEIMTPRINMEMLDIDLTLKEAMTDILNSSHSRIPLYEKTPERIVGILFIRDTLAAIKEQKLDEQLRALAKKPLVVPETKEVDDLFRQMQKQIQHIALIVDEYGSVVGLVTIEDILEEIVGEIYDETDIIRSNIVKLDKTSARVRGETPIEEVNRFLKTTIQSTDEYDTISGYVLKALGRIPEQGEEIEVQELVIVVEKVEHNRIVELKLLMK